MKNKKIYSATELSKYTYCNYSWYYEQKYTIKELRRLCKESNPEQYEKRNDNYARGRKFHEDYYRRVRRKRIAYIVLTILILGLIYLVIKNDEFNFSSNNIIITTSNS